MVMGFGRLLFKATSNTLASLSFSSILYLVVISLLFHSATSRPSASCRVDNCINPYKRANRRLEVAEERLSVKTDIPRRRCRILSRLHRCLQKMRKACRGDLTFHAMKHMTDRDLETYNCSAKPKNISPNVDLFPVKTDPEFLVTNATSVSTTAFPGEVTEGGACTFTGKPDYKHCGLFGDPHLRTFSDKFYTCKIEKTWPLIDNDYMVVMVTNVPVREGSSATVTTKITVLIKPAGECAGQQHYIATSEQLSGAFTDGSSTSGSVSVVEETPGRQVEIRARFIETTVIIRKVGRYLTFAIRMPHEFINGLDAKTQLCTSGCPAEHRILPADVNKDSLFINNRKTTPENKDKQTDFLSSNKVPKSLDEASPEMLQSELSTPSAIKLKEPRRRCYTEKEARLKCKEIMLATTEVQKHTDSNDDELKVSDDTEKHHRFPPSQSSEAFSSLIPSSRRNSRKGRKRNRMAAAKRPEAEMSQSSFKQLFGSEEKKTEAALLRQSGAESRRSRRQKNRNKRHTDAADNSANTEATKEEAPRVNKPKHDVPTFNFYFESCVFDLMTTNDVNFTLAASVALQDVQRTHVLREQAPGASLEVIKQWQPENIRDTGCMPMPPEVMQDTEDGYNGAGVPCLSWSVVVCFLISCAYINSISWLITSSPSNTVTSSKQPLTQSNTVSFSYLQQRTHLLNNRPTGR